MINSLDNDERYREFLAMDTAEMTPREISEAIGLSYSCIHYWLKKSGKASFKRDPMTSPEIIEDIRYEFPYVGLGALAKRYNVSEWSIRKIVSGYYHKVSESFMEQVLSNVLKDGVDVKSVVNSIITGEI